MNKKELLCPVGNMEAMYQAIHNGADAIYLSGKSYGARKYADNFTNEEIVEVINYAHKYAVKVYITVNTLIYDYEMDNVIKYIEFLYQNNVDAIIVQDIGLIDLVHQRMPNLVIHASTQAHNINLQSVNFFEKMGVKRVVLARELSIDEINNMDSDIELEVFIHGALCISYSGECLFSSIVLNRSGNRGCCAQPCRMPYQLYIDGVKQDRNAYLLSTKDLCTVDNFEQIMQSNIKSLKIEGRMKSPQYVGLITKIYRQLIDAYYDNKKISIDNDLDKLKHLFNRSFTKGNLFNENCIMNTKRGNHNGIEIGNVIEVNNKIITIKISNNLSLKDGIKFVESDKGLTIYNLYQNNEQIKHAEKNSIITIPNTIGLKTNDLVIKTFDINLTDELSKYELKKISCNLLVEAKLNKPLKLCLLCNDINIEVLGDVVTESINKPITKDDLIAKLTQLGDTIYKIDNVEIIMDNNIFIPLSLLKELKRSMINELDGKRIIKKDILFSEYHPHQQIKLPLLGLIVNIKTHEQLKAALDLNISNIITSNKDIMNKSKNVFFEPDINTTNISRLTNVLINNTGQYLMRDNHSVMLDYSFNIFNSNSINYFNDCYITLSPELKISDIFLLNKNNLNNVVFLAYGRIKLMTMKHCIINEIQKCNNCGLCDKNVLLKDAFNNFFPIKSDKKINIIYNSRPKNYIDEIDNLKTIGIQNFRIDLLDENYEESYKIIQMFKEKVSN